MPESIIRGRCLECAAVVEDTASEMLSAISLAIQTARSIGIRCNNCAENRPIAVTREQVAADRAEESNDG